MRDRHFLAAVAVVALSSLLFAASPARAAAPSAVFGGTSPRLVDCTLNDVTRAARCGTFDVAENPALPNGRHIGIRVAILPASTSPAQRDPVVLFMGGPGESAIDAAADVGVDLAQRMPDRDIVLIDQRGTGRSAPLACALYSEKHPEASVKDLFPPAAIARCLRTLRSRTDLTQYSFLRFAGDVEAVRRTLGYSQINIYSGSYGTRAAQVYVRAYPDAVRTMYLGSVVPIDIAMPLPFARAAQDMFEKTLDACERDASCHSAFPDIRNEARAVFARLASGRVTAPVSGGPGRIPVSAGRVAERMRAMMYRPAGAAAVPWALHRAYLDDWRPFVDGIVDAARAIDSALNQGVFFAITCSDDVRFIRESDIAPAVQGTLLGDYRVRQQQAACAAWPKAELPEGYREAVRSNVPTLFVSGDLDAATPLSFTAHVALGFSHRAEIVMRGFGHTGWDECVARAYTTLVRAGSVDSIDTTCEATPRPPFKTQP